LKGADILKVAPEQYKSTVKYPDTPVARKLRGAAQVHLADLGSRIFYLDHGSFDTHASQNPGHGNLWRDVSEGVDAFMTDLRQHDHADNVIVLLFSEFGRRVHDNGSGTDHGAAGPVFVLGEKVKGGHYGEYPSKSGRLGSGRPESQYGLPRCVLDDSGEVAEIRSEADRRGYLRAAGLPELNGRLPAPSLLPVDLNHWEKGWLAGAKRLTAFRQPEGRMCM